MEVWHKGLLGCDADLSKLNIIEARTKTRYVVEATNMIYAEHLYLISQPSQPSPLQGNPSSLSGFTDDPLDDNYGSSGEMLQDVRDYTPALDFKIGIIVDCSYLHDHLSRVGVLPGKDRTGLTFFNSIIADTYTKVTSCLCTTIIFTC